MAGAGVGGRGAWSAGEGRFVDDGGGRGARQRAFSLASGQRLELAVKVTKRPGVRLEIVPTTNSAGLAKGFAQLLYVENAKRQRFPIDGDRLLVAPGQYRFVFEGFGLFRVTLAQLRARDAKLVIIDG